MELSPDFFSPVLRPHSTTIPLDTGTKSAPYLQRGRKDTLYKSTTTTTTNLFPQDWSAGLGENSWDNIISSCVCSVHQTVELLLLGTSSGFVQLCDHRGQQISRQRVHKSACTNITLKAAYQGLDPDDSSEDLVVGFRDAVARLHALEVIVGTQLHLKIRPL